MGSTPSFAISISSFILQWHTKLHQSHGPRAVLGFGLRLLANFNTVDRRVDAKGAHVDCALSISARVLSSVFTCHSEHCWIFCILRGTGIISDQASRVQAARTAEPRLGTGA